jgi:chemotaxis protein methyltransferase CheR
METQSWLRRPFPSGAFLPPDAEPFSNDGGEYALAQALVENVGEPLLVLDDRLNVVTASSSFYRMFGLSRADVQGCPIYALGDGRWNLAGLRLLLERTALANAPVQVYEVEQDSPGAGRRLLRLTARRMFHDGDFGSMVLLAIEDLTDRRAKDRELTELLQRKDLSLHEMQHRIANSQQLIASILLMTARACCSDETRQHLVDAHRRVLAVAALQQQLQVSEPGGAVELGPYLSRLCETLAASLIGERQPISLEVDVTAGTAPSGDAINIGLVVTELVINALKHAFPGDRGGIVSVTYNGTTPNWRLDVSDNGIGKPDGGVNKASQGLGTSILQALARQLDVRLNVLTSSLGTTASLVHTSPVRPSSTLAQTNSAGTQTPASPTHCI